MPIDLKTLPEEIAPYVAAAVDYIFNAYRVDLDLSVESLAVVDHYITKARDAEPAIRDLLATAIGAYFGEALRKEMDGDWDLTEGREPAQWILDLPQGISLRPVGMAAEALAMDEVEGYDGAIYVPDDQISVLGAVLKAQDPLPPEQYYALSTRFEVIQKVTEALVAAKQRSGKQGDADQLK